MTDMQEDLTWLETTALGFLMGLVLITSWVIALASWLLSPDFWGRADKTVGIALIRGWARFNQAIHSRLATSLGIIVLATLAISSILLTMMALSPAAAGWFWENVFSQPWWPMPQAPK
mgnify:CR=1 FL=1